MPTTTLTLTPRVQHSTADRPQRAQGPSVPGWSAILVPVDCGEDSNAAVDCAIRLAAMSKASVVLLCVVGPAPWSGLPDARSTRQARAAVLDRARWCLTAIAKAHAASGVPMQLLVRAGVLEYEILKLAETGRVSVIVLGRPHRGAFRRLLFGDPVDDIVDCSRCPVLLVPS